MRSALRYCGWCSIALALQERGVEQDGSVFHDSEAANCIVQYRRNKGVLVLRVVRDNENVSLRVVRGGDGAA